jgi:hypothetical protein
MQFDDAVGVQQGQLTWTADSPPLPDPADGDGDG